MFRRRLYIFCFLLVCLHSLDVHQARLVGIGGLRACASKGDSQRPFHLFPPVVVDPMHDWDRTYRALLSIWASERRMSARQRQLMREELRRREAAQAEVFRQALSVRRNRKQAELFCRELDRRRATRGGLRPRRVSQQA